MHTVPSRFVFIVTRKYVGCDDCNAGTYSTSQGASGKSLCLPCPAGAYSVSQASTTCVTCQAGTYSMTEQASSSNMCLLCEGGKYAFRISAPAQGLLAVYVFSSAGFVQDSGPYNLMLTASGNSPVPGADCLFESCAEFKHQDQSFYLPIIPIADSSGFSLCLWYSSAPNVSSGQALFGFNEGQLFAGRLYESDDLIVRVYSGTHLVYYYTVIGGFQPGKWNHLCLCLDSDWMLTIYMNGTLQSNPFHMGDFLLTQNWTSNFIGQTAPKWSYDSSSYLGLIGEFRIYSRQLSPAEILELTSWRGQSYNATSCSMCLAGMFSSAQGASSESTCQLCVAGSYSHLNSSTACNLCAKGTFSSAVGSQSSTRCSDCYAGTYSDSPGSSNCSQCPAGTSSAISGASSNVSCIICPVGKTSEPGAGTCHKCSVLQSCYNWQCPAGQYRKGDLCETCTVCENINASKTKCTAYSDAQCAPCADSFCEIVQTTMTLTGFETSNDFEMYGSDALKASIAQGLGDGISAADVVILDVCDATGCTTVRRIIRGRSSSSDISVTFQVFSSADTKLIAVKLKMSNFSSTIATSMSHQTNRSINVSGLVAPNVDCQTGYYLDSSSACASCTICSAYLVQCGSNSDAVCVTSSQITEITAGAACAAGFLLIIVVTAVYRWDVTRKREEVSRRLMNPMLLDPCNTPVVEKDLPWALRNKYKPVSVLGRGAYGVVLEAVEMKNTSFNNLLAIKLIFPVGRYFTDEELKGIEREVVGMLVSPYIDHWSKRGYLLLSTTS